MNNAGFGEHVTDHHEAPSIEEDADSLDESPGADATVELTAREEIASLLEEDESRLGDVYRLHVLEGLTPQEVADRLNVATIGFVYGYKSRIDAILDGKVTTGATLQTQVTAAVRSFVKRSRSQVSAAAAQLLVSHLALAEQALAELTSSETTVEDPPRGDDADVDAGHLMASQVFTLSPTVGTWKSPSMKGPGIHSLKSGRLPTLVVAYANTAAVRAHTCRSRWWSSVFTRPATLILLSSKNNSTVSCRRRGTITRVGRTAGVRTRLDKNGFSRMRLSLTLLPAC